MLADYRAFPHQDRLHMQPIQPDPITLYHDTPGSASNMRCQICLSATVRSAVSSEPISDSQLSSRHIKLQTGVGVHHNYQLGD
jgi:hypothetical protein